MWCGRIHCVKNRVFLQSKSSRNRMIVAGYRRATTSLACDIINGGDINSEDHTISQEQTNFITSEVEVRSVNEVRGKAGSPLVTAYVQHFNAESTDIEYRHKRSKPRDISANMRLLTRYITASKACRELIRRYCISVSRSCRWDHQ